MILKQDDVIFKFKWDVSCDTCLHLCAADIMLVVAVGQSWISLDVRLKVL